MKESRFFYVPGAENKNELPLDEAMHALRVLRLKDGDEFFLMDGEGVFYRAEVTLAATKRCMYEIKERLPQERTWNGHLHLVIAPTKDMGRIEWMTEKATEVGFDELSFVCCQFSERRFMRTVRLDKIVNSAIKQSRKAWRPRVNPLVPFKEFIKSPQKGKKYICHCYDEIERKDFFSEISSPSDIKDVTVLVGPEGDFSIDEVRIAMANGYESVSLGSSRLRTETAGLYAMMMANLARRLLMFLLPLFIFSCFFTSCSNNDYLNAVPENSTALISVDLAKANEEAKGGAVMSNASLMKALFHISDVSDCGIDITQRVLLFEAADGSLGLVAKVNDEDDLRNTFDKMSEKGYCQKLKQQRGKYFTVLNKVWVAGFDKNTIQVMGPSVGAGQTELMRQIMKNLNAEEGIVGTPIYDRLEQTGGGVAMVAQASALPEKFISLFTLGAPADTDPSQVLIAAEIKSVKNCLSVECSDVFSFDKQIDAALHDYQKRLNPIEGKYLRNIPTTALFSLLINTDGTKLLPTLKQNKELRALLTGMGVKVDIDKFVEQVNGELLLTIPEGGDDLQMGWAADLTSDMSSLDKESLEELGKRKLGTASQLLPDSIQQLMKGKTTCLVINLSAVDGDKQQIISTLKGLMKPLFGDVSYLMFTNGVSNDKKE